MTLRTRLLLGFTMIFVVVIVAGIFTVTAQRNQLYDQIDDRLISTPLPPEARAGQEGANTGRDRAAQPVDDETISDLYVAVFDDEGLLRPVIEGQLLFGKQTAIA